MPDRQVDRRTHESYLRAQEVCRLRVKEGKSFREIADTLGISHQGASKLFRKWMEQVQATTREEATVAREVELMRLDGLWERAYRDAVNEHAEPEDRARAQGICIRLSERRARLLGLDSSEKLEVTGKDGGPINMRTTFDFSGLEGDALDRELAGYYNPGHVEGTVTTKKVGKAKPKAKPKAKTATQARADARKAAGGDAPKRRGRQKKVPAPSVLDEAPEHLMPVRVDTARTDQSPPPSGSQGRARI